MTSRENEIERSAFGAIIEAIGPEPEATVEDYAPRRANGHAQAMTARLDQEQPPELSRELATRLMDETTDTADTIYETGQLLHSVSAHMRHEGQQLADWVVDFDRRREAQKEFARSIKAYVAETNMLRRQQT